MCHTPAVCQISSDILFLRSHMVVMHKPKKGLHSATNGKKNKKNKKECLLNIHADTIYDI